jgi:K+-sensing histidine kinase KdpD
MARSYARSAGRFRTVAAAATDALRRFGRHGLLPGSAGAYLFAAASIGSAALAHVAFTRFSPDIAPSILYNAAVFIAVLFGGLHAGLAAVGLGAALLWWGFESGYLGVRAAPFASVLALYLFAALVIVWIAEQYRSFAAPDAHGGSRFLRAADWLRPNSLAGYITALACIVIATLIRAGFERLGGEMLPLVSYYPAVLVAALMGGAGAGLLAMILSLAAVWWQFPAPLLSLGPVTREESVGLSLYVFVSVLTVWLAENRRQATRAGSEGMAIFALATSVLVAFTAVLLTTLVLLAVDSYLAPDHLVLGYLLPTLVIAMHYGSTLAVVTAFASGMAAAYFLFPPKLSFNIAEPLNVAELGFFLLLAVIASKAVAVLADDSMRSTRTRGRTPTAS